MVFPLIEINVMAIDKKYHEEGYELSHWLFEANKH